VSDDFPKMREVKLWSNHLCDLFEMRHDLDLIWALLRRRWKDMVDPDELATINDIMKGWQKECSESLDDYLNRMIDNKSGARGGQ